MFNYLTLPLFSSRIFHLFIRPFFYGMLLLLGFAPFHLPGFSILALALMQYELFFHQKEHCFLKGLFFGLGFFGLGVSWVYVSVHEYGHLTPLLAAFITFCFILYLSLYFSLAFLSYSKLSKNLPLLIRNLLFATIWTLFEYLRAHLFGGFPWILLGYTLVDTPAKTLLPIVGLFGGSFFVALISAFLSNVMITKGKARYLWMTLLALGFILPAFLKPLSSIKTFNEPLSVGIIQSNLSMRDKWDENLFWQLIEHYQKATEKLLGTHLIVLPESAIPLPSQYIESFLDLLDHAGKEAKSAILLGIPETTDPEETHYYNTLKGLGLAEGVYVKQHLVPFGEYIPKFFQKLTTFLSVEDPAIEAGKKHQTLLTVQNHPIASLICYELGYAHLLKNQLPEAEWIVSISDDGWFGHSLALYQHQQMAQALSLLSGRYQVVANNDGLSSVINQKGEILNHLPAFKKGTLKGVVFPSTGSTYWALFGDFPILSLCFIFLVMGFIVRFFEKV